MILVGTHIVAWLAFDQSQLPKNARAAIDDARSDGHGLAISDITLLELTTLSKKGQIRIAISLESFLRDVEARFIVLPTSMRASATRNAWVVSEGSGRSHHRGHRSR